MDLEYIVGNIRYNQQYKNALIIDCIERIINAAYTGDTIDREFKPRNDIKDVNETLLVIGEELKNILAIVDED